MPDTKSEDRSVTQSLLRDLYGMAEYITTHAAVLPTAPWAMDVSFKAETRGHLDEIAEHFGVKPYGPEHGQRAQIAVYVPGAVGFVRLFVTWEQEK